MKTLKIDTALADRTRRLTDAELGRLFRSVLEYARTEQEPELSGRESVAFEMLREEIDEQIRRSASRSETNRANVSKRYSTNRNDSYQVVAIRNDSYIEEKKEKGSPSLPPTPPISSLSKEKEEKKERSILKDTKKERPTEAEVAAYVKERNLNVDPHEFWDYFETGNWHDSKGQPVRNWKQKLLTWNKLGAGRTKSAGRDGMGARAPYKQTQLTDEQLNSLFVDLDTIEI